MARRLQEVAVGLGSLAAPLRGVAGVIAGMGQALTPDGLGDAERVTGRADTQIEAVEHRVVSQSGIVAALVALPDRQRGLIPPDIAGLLHEVGAATADGHVGAVAVADVRCNVLPQYPGLQHPAGLVVGRRLIETSHDADDGSIVDGGGTLPENESVFVHASKD